VLILNGSRSFRIVSRKSIIGLRIIGIIKVGAKRIFGLDMLYHRHAGRETLLGQCADIDRLQEAEVNLRSLANSAGTLRAAP
jgi:hypothetical protein